MRKSREILTMVLSVFAAITLSGCSQIFGDLSPSSVSIVAIETYLENADTLAYSWRKDAILQKVDIMLRSPLSESSSQEITYFYDSISPNVSGIMVICEQNHCQLIEVEYTADIVLKICPLLLENVTMNSQDVLNYALEHGGRSFLDKENTKFHLVLDRGVPLCQAHNSWLISFYTITEAGMRYWFNADTGELSEPPL